MATARARVEAPVQSSGDPEPLLGVWPLRIPVSAFTLDGFRKWAVSDEFPERGRISFLDQALVIDMDPEMHPSHSGVRLEVTMAIYRLTQRPCSGVVFPGRTLLTNLKAGFATEPDAIFASEERFRSGKVRLLPQTGGSADGKELLGAPDWVLEVVSDSSVQKDRVQLRRLYHLAGIPEFWLIDARGETLDFQLLIRGPKDYVPAPRRGTWLKSQVFGRSFRLVRQQNRIGRTVYRLQVKRS